METVHKLVLTCKEATEASTRKEEGKISFFLNLRLSLHYLACPPCRRFINQFKLIAKGMRSYGQSAATQPSHQLSPEKKKEIQEKIKRAC